MFKYQLYFFISCLLWADCLGLKCYECSETGYIDELGRKLKEGTCSNPLSDNDLVDCGDNNNCYIQVGYERLPYSQNFKQKIIINRGCGDTDGCPEGKSLNDDYYDYECSYCVGDGCNNISYLTPPPPKQDDLICSACIDHEESSIFRIPDIDDIGIISRKSCSNPDNLVCCGHKDAACYTYNLFDGDDVNTIATVKTCQDKTNPLKFCEKASKFATQKNLTLSCQYCTTDACNNAVGSSSLRLITSIISFIVSVVIYAINNS